MNINQLTETNPIELARAVLTADDVKDFPIIHYAAVQLLNALVTFEMEASYFEYDDLPDQEWCEPDDVAVDSDCPFCGSVAGQQCSDITTNTEIASAVHVERINALITFEVEASYFEYEEPDDVAADTPDIIMISRACFHELAQDEKLAQDFAKSLTNSIFGRMDQGKKHGEE
jgi:hypothetical protein